MLDEFSSTLRVDAYSGYNWLSQENREGGLGALSYCWPHVRRKFPELVTAGKQERA